MATKSEENENWRSLLDDEIVAEGDIVKDLEGGEYREVASDSFDGLLIGMTARVCRGKFDRITDMLRTKE